MKTTEEQQLLPRLQYYCNTDYRYLDNSIRYDN
jgi:hypothetical protein